MHEERCPVCGAQSWSLIYKNSRTRDIVGCDICCDALDEIDSCEEGLFGDCIQNHR
jgi:hypothetical protein